MDTSEELQRSTPAQVKISEEHGRPAKTVKNGEQHVSACMRGGTESGTRRLTHGVGRDQFTHRHGDYNHQAAPCKQHACVVAGSFAAERARVLSLHRVQLRPHRRPSPRMRTQGRHKTMQGLQGREAMFDRH